MTYHDKWRKFLKEEEDYRGSHGAPDSISGAPLWNVAANGVYPDDFYGPMGFDYYRPHSDGDREAYGIIRQAWGRRDKQVKIFRAVPKGIKTINPGDWVAITRTYAKDHGESALNGDYRILTAFVNARDSFTDGDSFEEWGWDPQPRVPYSEREPWEKWPGKKI